MYSTLLLSHAWRSYPDRWLFVTAWTLIFAECSAVVWAVEHWAVPVAAGWIIGPTLVFVVPGTIVWFGHCERQRAGRWQL